MRSNLQPLYLGVDGGGTNCRVRLCDHLGQVIGAGEAGSANTTLGVELAFQQILKATEIAVSKAGLAKDCYERIHAGLGLAGLSLQRDHKAINSYRHPFASLRAETDAHIACMGAHQGDEGAILIIGTGSCGLYLNGGKAVNVGGWGFAMSDIGSGAHLGRFALRRALEEHDGIAPKSSIGSALMAHFDHSPEAMVTWSETATPKNYGSFAPEVFSHANLDDVVASKLVQETAHDVERLLLTLISEGADKIVLLGGLAEPILPWLSSSIVAHLTEAKGDPLDGALMLSRKHQEKVTDHV